MSQVQFAFPMAHAPFWAAAGVAVLVLAYWVLRALERRHANRLHAFVEAELAPRLLEGYDARLRRPLSWFTLAGLAFLLLAFAQPRWGEAWVEKVRASRDVLVVLDTSESMNAENPLPSRLERARQKVEALMRHSPGDRFGLIVFSGDAVLQCPLTSDHAYFMSVLQAVDTDTMTIEGTNIAAALEEALAVFEQDARESGQRDPLSRAVLLISDGEEVQGEAVAAAKPLAQEAVLYVLGIGTPEGISVHFPEWMLQYARVPHDKRAHLSKLDEKTLSQIALASDLGVYVRSTPDNSDIEHVLQEMEGLRAQAVSSELRMHLVNRYRWPLAAGLFCFAAEGFWIALMPVLRRWRLRKAANGEAAGEEQAYA